MTLRSTILDGKISPRTGDTAELSDNQISCDTDRGFGVPRLPRAYPCRASRWKMLRSNFVVRFRFLLLFLYNHVLSSDRTVLRACV
jgi:hypothetical protein